MPVPEAPSSQARPPLNLIDRWQPGCWCGAALLTSQAHEVEGPETIDRYPEQWMFVVWRPMDRALPFWRPDGWGHTIGPPWDALADAAEGAAFLLLQEADCLWSAWLEMALTCETTEPWYTDALRRCRDEQLAAERRRYVQWYGSDVEEFQHFMGDVLAGTAADPALSTLRPPMEPPVQHADKPGWIPASQVQFKPEPNILRWRVSPGGEGIWVSLADGSLKLELIDGFGWPFEHYIIEAADVSQLCQALADLSGVLVPDWRAAFSVTQRAFEAWSDFMAWLLESGVPVQLLPPGLE